MPGQAIPPEGAPLQNRSPYRSAGKAAAYLELFERLRDEHGYVAGITIL
jgi:hypothetical protein